MIMKITNNCISCGTCSSVCPVNAPNPGDVRYEIDKDKCVECKGFFDKPQCQLYCPVDCIIKAEEG